MTTTLGRYPSRVGVTFQGKKGEVALDQLRTVDQRRLMKSWAGSHRPPYQKFH